LGVLNPGFTVPLNLRTRDPGFMVLWFYGALGSSDSSDSFGTLGSSEPRVPVESEGGVSGVFCGSYGSSVIS
jgi:hypothetical protein